MKAKVTEVLPIDIYLANPLHPRDDEQYDVISVFAALEVVARSVEGYRLMARNITGLLKPGGRIIAAGALGLNYITVSSHKLPTLSVTAPFVQSVYEELGFHDIHVETGAITSNLQLISGRNFYIMHATKPTS